MMVDRVPDYLSLAHRPIKNAQVSISFQRGNLDMARIARSDLCDVFMGLFRRLRLVSQAPGRLMAEHCVLTWRRGDVATLS